MVMKVRSQNRNGSKNVLF